MSLDEHHYALTVRWTGNLGAGTSSYRGYSRDHDIEIPGLPVLRGSADPTFHGDRERYNPEQLLLAALSQCHMLSFLHVAVKHGVVVTAYEDRAEANKVCFIARSVNFPVLHEPTDVVEGQAD